VSILQKSRVQLHLKGATEDKVAFLCQSFRNQGFSYTRPENDSRDDPNRVNPSEIKGSVTPRVTNLEQPGHPVSILQKSRVQLHPWESRSRTWIWVVSILQKSRVQLHSHRRDRNYENGVCQSFRNQGFSYTAWRDASR